MMWSTQSDAHAPVITVIGHSGAGKTTLIVFLLEELGRRGYRLATVKHHSHSGFEIDQQGKDSWRFAQAGSRHVVISAPDKIASYRLLEQELELDAIVSQITGVDLVLVEGYKRANRPTIEVVKPGDELLSQEENLVAIVADRDFGLSLPVFGRGDGLQVADLIEARFLKP